MQDKALKQMHLNHMDTKKTRLLACESMYWINMNTDAEETVRNCPTGLDFQAAGSKR